jgi:hypothetical protein
MLCNKHLHKLETPVAATATARKPKINTNNENVIVSHHNPATSVCSFVLLSGARKGCPCGKPMWMPKSDVLPVTANGVYCKAHYGKGVMLLS